MLLVPVAECLQAHLNRDWHVLVSPEPGADRDNLLARHGADVEVIIGHTTIDAALISACPKLHLIATFAAGYENVDLPAARAAGVAVVPTLGCNAGEVADSTIMLLLAAVKRLPHLDRHVRSGAWAREGQPAPQRGLSSMAVGVAGTGPVGRAILKRLSAFDAELHCFSRHRPADLVVSHHTDIRSIAAASDALVLALPGGPETHHIVDAAILDALGPEGVLVNVGRGGLVDETALVAALEADRFGFAALDVFEDEPHIPARLRNCDRVILTPHYAGASPEARSAKARHLVATLAAFAAADPLPDRVT